MQKFTPFSLNLRGRLVEFSRPQVMGIINVTPDSFYADSRVSTVEGIKLRISSMLESGADWIDIGACSTRPGASEVSADEEIDRLAIAVSVIKSYAPDAIISIDTFRAHVAQIAVQEMGADIVNDISGGNMDGDMLSTVASMKVPYILMHTRGTPQTMGSLIDYRDVTGDVLAEIAAAITRAGIAGINDIIIDPGFGFAKTLEQNYKLLHDIELFHVFERPILVGMSRKRMIYNALDVTADNALNGTTVANTIALMGGASILRVHDVAQAREAVRIVGFTQNS